MLTVSDAEMRALAAGESIVAFAPRMSATEGDELELSPSGPIDPAMLKPAYRRWARTPAPTGDWTAVVVSVDPAAILDPEAGSARHILTEAPDGDVLLVRVYGPEGAVLDDEAFDARQRSVEGALRP